MSVSDKTGTFARLGDPPRLTQTARRQLLLTVMPVLVLAAIVAAIAAANPNFLRPASLWTVLDLTPGGRGTDWYPRLDY